MTVCIVYLILFYANAKINASGGWFFSQDIMQKDMFLDVPDRMVPIEEVASKMQVSVATIKNWIKTGELSLCGKNFISERSLDYFTQNGFKERLSSRANKLQKESCDNEKILQAFLPKIKSTDYSVHDLGNLYQESLSESYRNKEGIYYTPKQIVNDLLIVNGPVTENMTFCDPCCGSGNFVIRALELGFSPENIYAFDVDPVAVEITKERIFRYSGYKSHTVQRMDFLDAICKQDFNFDYIYTNPPWGKKISKKLKNFYGTLLNSGYSLDTSSLFYFACLKALNEKGEMGLLLPESFFNIASFECARKSLLKFKIYNFTHYARAFDGLMTNVCSFRMKKEESSTGLIHCKTSIKTMARDKKTFLNNPKSILNITCCASTAEILDYLWELPHITLQNNAEWALGIVTGNNKKFMSSRKREGDIPVYKGTDILNGGIKPATNFIPADLSLYQQVAPIRLYLAKEKLIYKFISSKLVFYYDTEKRYILNSANMLVLKPSFPFSYKVLADLLNSDFMNWIFKNIFSTHKILKKDLETLPIHMNALEGMEIFDEYLYLDRLGLENVNGTYRIKK